MSEGKGNSILSRVSESMHKLSKTLLIPTPTAPLSPSVRRKLISYPVSQQSISHTNGT